MLQVRRKLVQLRRPHFFQFLLELWLENGAIHHVANAPRTSFVVTNLALLLIDLPGRTHAIAPVVWRRSDYEIGHVFESRNAMQTIANHLSLGSELSFVSELLKVAAATTTKVRTRRFNSDGRGRENLFDGSKQHVPLDAF